MSDIVLHHTGITPWDSARSQENILMRYLGSKRAPNTRKAYYHDLTAFFGTAELTVELVGVVRADHINAHLQRLMTAGAKPSSVRRRLAAIRDFFEWLVADEVLEKTPVVRKKIVALPSPTRTRKIVYLTEAEARALLEASGQHPVTGVRDRALVHTLLRAWLRRSEASAMDFDHIEHVGGYFTLFIPSPKSGDGQIVKLPDVVAEEIEVMRRHYELTGGAVWRSLGPRAYGRRLNDRSVFRIVYNAAVLAGLIPKDDEARGQKKRRIGAHTLRHTGCTLAIKGGASLSQVQEQARHASPTTTAGYVHLTDFLGDNATDRIDL